MTIDLAALRKLAKQEHHNPFLGMQADELLALLDRLGAAEREVARLRSELTAAMRAMENHPDPTPEQVERVAKAIHIEDWNLSDTTWDSLSAAKRSNFMDAARAAIAAMKDIRA